MKKATPPPRSGKPNPQANEAKAKLTAGISEPQGIDPSRQPLGKAKAKPTVEVSKPQAKSNQKVFWGDPAKQRDPAAIAARLILSKECAPLKPALQKKTVSSSLPPPSRVHDATKQPVRAGNPMLASLFDDVVKVRHEKRPQLHFADFSSLMEVSTLTHQELTTKYPTIMAKVPLELFNYYSTVVAQLRMLSIRKSLGIQPLTVIEDMVLETIRNTALHIPQPILERFPTIAVIMK